MEVDFIICDYYLHLMFVLSEQFFNINVMEGLILINKEE